MRIYRLSRSKYAHELSGKGAARFGNRWNSKGTEVVYTAESRALACAELIVQIVLNRLPDDYQVLTIRVPDKFKIQTINPDHLPFNWNRFPHVEDTQKIGDQLVEKNEYVLLKVPSAVVHGDYNVLLNPRHKDFEQIKIINTRPFPIDERLYA
jgi:RES domain-containing protein